MEDKRRDGKKSRQFGFAQLLIECCTIKPIPGFTCAFLEQHPFGLQILKRQPLGFTPEICYVGEGSTEPSVRGITRLVGWEITNQCLGNHNPVYFLRVIYVPGGPPYHITDLYYEVSVGMRHYMTGGCNDKSGAGMTGARKMRELFMFFSQIYGVPVNRHDVPVEQGGHIRHNLMDALDKEHRDCEQRWEEILEEWERWPQFLPGHEVKLTEEGVQSLVGGSFDEQLKQEARQPLLVRDVETVPNHCSCGLGDRKSFPVIVHPEQKCNLRRRHEMLHNQIVTVKLGGYERKVTGYYLMHV